MYNPTAGYMAETRDIILLHCMYYGMPQARDQNVAYSQVTLPLKLKKAEEKEGEMLNAS